MAAQRFQVSHTEAITFLLTLIAAAANRSGLKLTLCSLTLAVTVLLVPSAERIACPQACFCCQVPDNASDLVFKDCFVVAAFNDVKANTA
jgi:hypothetical protein